MKKQRQLVGYILIGLGIYFLLLHLNITIVKNFYTWPTILIIIGIAFLIHSYANYESNHIFTGILLLGIGIHFHGLAYSAAWINHWSIYLLIIGLAFIMRYFKTKTGLIVGIVLTSISTIMLLSIKLPASFQPIYTVIDFIETFWPVAIIIIGVYFLRK